MDVERRQQRGAGLAGAVDGDPRDARGDDAAVEAAVEVPRLDRGAVPGGEHQPGIDPAVSGTIIVGILLFPADVKSSHTQVRKRKGRLRGLCLDLAADELASHALELLADIQLGGIQVDLIPGKAKDFSPAQAEDENQDEGGVERLADMPGGIQEPSRVVNGPSLPLAALSRRAAFGHLTALDGVTGDCLVFYRAAERGADR